MKSPFTLEQVEAMTTMAHAGETQTAIGRKYGVDRKVIGRLIRGEAGPLSVRALGKARPTIAECNSAQRAIACELKARGVPLTQIGSITRLKYREIEALPKYDAVAEIPAASLEAGIVPPRCPPRNSQEALDHLMDCFVEDVLALSDEDVLAEAEDDKLWNR